MSASTGSMVIRVRSRDGTERVSVPSVANVAILRQSVTEQLKVSPDDEMILSLHPDLLLAAHTESPFDDLTDETLNLSNLGVRHGSVVYMRCSQPRHVPGPAVVTPAGAYGRHMTVEDMIARQTRIERQEKAQSEGVSFDREAAYAFQQYVHQTLAFSVRRGGFMYGKVSEEGEVMVDFIYEPPQKGAVDNLIFLRDKDEEKRVDLIASGLGMRRVGFVFTRAVSGEDQSYTMGNAEIRQIAELQTETGLEQFSAAVVKLETNEEGTADVHFEAFQLSDQCLKLYREDWFVDSPETPQNLSRMKAEVVLAGKDTQEVDNDFFLVPVKIQDHQGILRSTFPVENRFSPSSERELRQHLERTKGRPFSERIADFHLLLFLSRFLDPETDLLPLAEAVQTRGPVPDGYQLIIEAL